MRAVSTTFRTVATHATRHGWAVRIDRHIEIKSARPVFLVKRVDAAGEAFALASRCAEDTARAAANVLWSFDMGKVGTLNLPIDG